jgi:hypothetical protein
MGWRGLYSSKNGGTAYQTTWCHYPEYHSVTLMAVKTSDLKDLKNSHFMVGKPHFRDVLVMVHLYYRAKRLIAEECYLLGYGDGI